MTFLNSSAISSWMGVMDSTEKLGVRISLDLLVVELVDLFLQWTGGCTCTHIRPAYC